MPTNILTDELTGSIIAGEDIYYSDDKDIVTVNGKCWKLTPRERTSENTLYDDGRYSFREKAPALGRTPLTLPFNEGQEAEEGAYTDKARYFFGLKGLRFGNRKYAKNSGICSEPVEVDNELVSILADIDYGKNSSVEFYIVDGISEYPVLAEGENRISHEKLFYGLPTRFDIDNSKAFRIYKNGTEVDVDYRSLSFEELTDNDYTISYVPLDPDIMFLPNNKQVSVKVIIRCFGDDFIPAKVSRLALKKTRREETWN